jgi:hypothetical protein
MNGEGPMVLWRCNDASQPSVAADATGQGRTGSVSRAVYTADGGGVTGKAGDRALSFGGTGVMTVPSAAAGAFDAVVAAAGPTTLEAALRDPAGVLRRVVPTHRAAFARMLGLDD